MKQTSEGGLCAVHDSTDMPLLNGINVISTDFTNFLMARHTAVGQFRVYTRTTVTTCKPDLDSYVSQLSLSHTHK